MKKRLISLIVLFLLVLSIFTLAEDTAVKTPSFWEKKNGLFTFNKHMFTFLK